MRALAAPALFLLMATGLQAQFVPQVDPKSILQSLNDIKAKQAAASTAQINKTITSFNAAAGSDSTASDFLMQAVWATQFAGRDQGDSAYNEWKKFVGPQLNADAIRTALRYTTISLQRAAGATDKQIFPVLLAYAQDTEPLLPKIAPREGRAGRFGGGFFGQQQGGAGGAAGAGGAQGGARGGRRGEQRGGGAQENNPQRPTEPLVNVPGLFDIMTQPVGNNIFSKWYQVTEQLGGLNADEWESVPANVDAMYQKILLPYMRQTRDPRIINYWDNKLALEKSEAADAAAEFTTDEFNQIRQPELLWSRAEDYLLLGQKDRAISDMYNVVKTYTNHPSAGKWISELQSILTAPAGAASTSAPAATLAPMFGSPAPPAAAAPTVQPAAEAPVSGS